MIVSAFQQTSENPGRRPVPPGPDEPQGQPPREPMFNAPLPALILVALIIGGFALQGLVSDVVVIRTLAFVPADLATGRWTTLVTALFVHGGWPHALMNAAFAMAFGAPVARMFGPRAPGMALFFVFYLLCGVLANLGYGLLHMSSPHPLVGASGAVCGLSAVAARLLAGRGRLGPTFSGPVIAMGAALAVASLLVAVAGSALTPGAGGAQIAWEAHLFGFLAGLLLIIPFARILERR